MTCALYTYNIHFFNNDIELGHYCAALTAAHKGYAQDVIEIVQQAEVQLGQGIEWTHVSLENPELYPKENYKKIKTLSKAQLETLKDVAAEDIKAAQLRQQKFIKTMHIVPHIQPT
ncbi:MAG: hypothetical protein CMH30_07510 [Micavibrio sp.]|nr:hypothetical protein [Micavibrio sp.]|tara:strand:- start:824 stop:1171 length:348 start_codon:yes stop_codon:yes gene_type:complete